MEFAVLGPLLVRHRGAPVEIGAPKQRALLIHLLLRVGQTVPVDRLIDALWEDDPPPQARVTLRSYVSNLRRVLTDAGDTPVIVTRGNGYSVQVPPEAVDATRFVRLVNDARQATAEGAPGEALALLDDALALWRGEALADVAGSAFAIGERHRLEELRLSAHEERFAALLDVGRHDEAVAALEAFTADNPLRERARGQLMVALYRCGRTADALATFRAFREALGEELGLDPTQRLQDLADRILRQEEPLGRAAAVVPPSPPPVAAGDSAARGLVGRSHERTELQAAVGRLRAGAGGLLLVTGEAGIGKSTLLEELAQIARDQDLGVRWGRCQETKGAPAFWPWVQVVRAVADDLDDARLRELLAGPAAAVGHLVEAVAVRSGTPPPPLDADLEAARFQLYDAVASFLLHSAGDRGLVVLLDDLHWADAPSLETLAFLAPLLGSARVLVAATYRDVRGEWANDLEATLATVVREPSTQQVGLVGLPPDAVAQLAEHLTGDALSDDQRDVLHRRTGGNPFFVRQLSQLLYEGDAGADPAIPAAVGHVISRRLSRLPAGVRALLESASVIGGQFDVRWLAAATGTAADEALDAAATAAAHALIEPVGRSATAYRFVHALVRETVYDRLTPVQAARTHAQVAAALETTPNTPVTALAEHFWRAADVIDDDRPVQYLLAAADAALEIVAFEQAETYLRQVLELLGRREGEETLELQVRVRLVHLLTAAQGWSSAGIEEVAAPGRRLARAAASTPDVIPLWAALFVHHLTRGEAPIARAMAEQLLAEAQQGGHPAAVAASRIAASQLLLSQGSDAQLALDHARAAVEQAEHALADGVAGAMDELLVPATYMCGCALAICGDTAAAIDTARQAVKLAHDSGSGFTQAVTAMVAAWIGALVDDPAFAADVSVDALQLAERHGLPQVAAVAAVTDGWARAALGADAAAQASRMRETIDALLRAGHVAEQPRRLLLTAQTFLRAVDPDAAGECLAQARELATTTGETLPVEWVQRVEQGLA